jgi:hypothetical protein
MEFVNFSSAVRIEMSKKVLTVLILLFLLALALAFQRAAAAPSSQSADEPVCVQGFWVTVSNIEKPSTHDGTTVTVVTDVDTLVLQNVEAYPGQISSGFVCGTKVASISVTSDSGQHSIDIDTDVFIVEITPTPNPTKTSTPVPSETPTATITPTGTFMPTETPPATETPSPTAEASPTPGATSTPMPTATPPASTLNEFCLRVNWEVAGQNAREGGVILVRKVDHTADGSVIGAIVYSEYQFDGWTDSGDWMSFWQDGGAMNVVVQILLAPYSVYETYDHVDSGSWLDQQVAAGYELVTLKNVNGSPTEGNWLAPGICHALEVGWP